MPLPSLHSEIDIIAALSSAPGRGAIAILRLSGDGCHTLARQVLRGRGDWNSGKLQRCQLVDPDIGVIDDGMAVFFSGPASYTGQDMVEVYVHGGTYIIQKSLALFYRLGARPAEAGEFTRRAYLAGKIDLSSAEGIHELIDAETEGQWQAARSLASGQLFGLIRELRQGLIDAQAWLAARIDFPDEEDSQVDLSEVDKRVFAVREKIKALDLAYDSGRIASKGLRVVILGKPNVGKSTLLNTLLDFKRAIVSDIAGTTRDYLEESCLVHGRMIRLVDTAGIRRSNDQIEAIGVEQSRELAKEADLILVLANEGLSQAEELITSLQLSTKQTLIRVKTKVDLESENAFEGSASLEASLSGSSEASLSGSSEASLSGSCSSPAPESPPSSSHRGQAPWAPSGVARPTPAPKGGFDPPLGIPLNDQGFALDPGAANADSGRDDPLLNPSKDSKDLAKPSQSKATSQTSSAGVQGRSPGRLGDPKGGFETPFGAGMGRAAPLGVQGARPRWELNGGDSGAGNEQLPESNAPKFPESNELPGSTTPKFPESKVSELPSEKSSPSWLKISCHTGKGIADLRQLIAHEVDTRLGGVSQNKAIVSNPRQKRCLELALGYLQAYEEGRKLESYDEMLSFELQQATKALEEIIGHCDVEDVLDSVFKNFCMGK